MKHKTNVAAILKDAKEQKDKQLQKAARRPKKLRKSRAVLEERRREVLKLKMEGYSVSEMQVALQATETEIRNDLKVIRDRNVQRATGEDIDNHIGASLSVYERIQAESWKRYQESDDSKKPKYLDIIRAAENDKNKFLSNVGHIDKKPQEQTLRVEHSVVADLSRETTVSIRKALLKGHASRTLPEPEPRILKTLLEADEIIDVTNE